MRLLGKVSGREWQACCHCPVIVMTGASLIFCTCASWDISTGGQGGTCSGGDRVAGDSLANKGERLILQPSPPLPPPANRELLIRFLPTLRCLSYSIWHSRDTHPGAFKVCETMRWTKADFWGSPKPLTTNITGIQPRWGQRWTIPRPPPPRPYWSFPCSKENKWWAYYVASILSLQEAPRSAWIPSFLIIPCYHQRSL